MTQRHPAPPPRTPRVLHLYRRFHPDFTGDGIYYQQLIPLLRERSSTHDILVMETPAPPPGEELNAAEYRAFYLSKDGAPAGLASLYAWIGARRHDYDILHIHSHVDRHFMLYLFVRSLGWKVIFSCTLEDSPSHLLESYRPLYRPLVRRLLGLIDVFVAISPRLMDGITAVFPPERAQLIPQGVRLPPLASPEQQAAYRRKHGIGEHTTVLLYVGSISARKNVAFLVQQLAALREQHADILLIVVGPMLEEEHGALVERLIRENGLAERVLLTGYKQDPHEFYAIGDIFVFASESEGFGNVLLEAMSIGLPVVSRRLDGVTDYFIEDGKTGFLFTRPEEYRRQVLSLIQDTELREAIGRRSYGAVRESFSLEAIAERYITLYRTLTDADREPDPAAPAHRTDVGCRSLNHGPAAAGMMPLVQAGADRPILTVVIDTEAEFDWSRGVAADKGSVTSIAQLDIAQRIFEEFGINPCYVVDYPVASHAESAAIMREMRARGAEVGAHLQPWTNPPIEEPLDQWHAYPGNLSLDLQRRKLTALVEVIERMIGLRPTVHKAGRYGLSVNTMDLLEEMGFEVDLSVGSGFDFRAEGGPDFTEYTAEPYVFGSKRQLLELPTTGGYTGFLRRGGKQLWQFTARRGARALHMRGVLDRSHALSRVRLSPEGYTVTQLADLTRGLLSDGLRVFSFSFHSSSLKPGFTPYVQNDAQLVRMCDTMRRYFEFFLGEIGGIALTPTQTRARLLEQSTAAPARAASPAFR